MALTKLFRSNRRKLSSLQKDVAFPQSMKDVVIPRDIVRRVIVPASTGRDDFVAALSVDLVERWKPPAQLRNEL